ncbi:unnamed protein product [Phytophthora fragariaefolia]|uniref:Unnamed protein product n=1 Tax=Phytophthora fragariaefolia TaxID=1490495 RepID=A0A9W6XMN4_9STRA|nr:unnamed protein product [Phytophthora fragariaefolia]
MRETYISINRCAQVSRGLAKNHPRLTFADAYLPRNSVESDWNAAWIMDVEEAVWKPSEQGVKVDLRSGNRVFRAASDDTTSVSLLSMFEIISQLVHLEVALGIEERTLYV